MLKMFIDYLEAMSEITPVVVCGAARSGTRMMTDILNSHPTIAIQEEMHAITAEAFFRLVDTVDENFSYYSERKGACLDAHWQKHKFHLAIAFFSFACKKSLVGHGKDITHFGFKTPGYERYFQNFEKIFNARAKYIYCVRNPQSVWRSWKSLGFLDDVELFLSRYRRSLRQAIKMKNGSSSRMVVFQLDDYINANDKSSFVQTTVFNRLDLPLISELSTVENLENRNSAERRNAELAQDERTLIEMERVAKDEKIIEFREVLLG